MSAAEPRPLVIVGAGGHAREMAWTARALGRPVIGFLDDAPRLQGARIGDHSVLGMIDSWVLHRDAEFVLAFGSPRLRRDIDRRMASQGQPRFASLIHPSAIIAPGSGIADGAMIGAGAVISCDVSIGRHAIVNIGASISHDALIGAFATIAPGVAVPGATIVEEGAEVALQAALRQGLRIGRGALVGAGAVVTGDVPPQSVVVGNPARTLRTLDQF